MLPQRSQSPPPGSRLCDQLLFGPETDQIRVSLGYCVVMAVLGATYGMQGPAALNLATQNGLIFRVNCTAATVRASDNSTTVPHDGAAHCRGPREGGAAHRGPRDGAAHCRASDNSTLNTAGLTKLGYANTLDAFAGVFGGLLGGWIVDRSSRWHIWLALYTLWQAAAVVGFTRTHSFVQLLIASLAWGWSSTMPSLSTQVSEATAPCSPA
eukprot:COSAG01_NODE_319_length_18909_cov_32.636151_1_plen_211_part_00